MSGINPIAEELRDSPEYTLIVDVDDGETGESHVRITPDLRDRILAALKDRDVVLEEAAKGIRMIHDALADPSRPRQACGEVAAYWLDRIDAALKERV